MSGTNKGLRIGNYRVTPLGLATLAVLIVVIIAVVVIAVNPFGGSSDGSVITVEQPTVEPTAAPTVAPVAAPVIDEEPADEEMSDGNTGDDMDAGMTDEGMDADGGEETAYVEPGQSATIRVVGEIAIMQTVLDCAKQEDGTYDFDSMFSEVSELMGNADYTIADVEGVMGGTIDPVGDNNKIITPVSLIDTLSACGVDMLNIANDHAMDGGFDELMAELANLNDRGMDYVGAATSVAEKDTAKVININGINVGFIAYTTSLGSGQSSANTDALTYGINVISGSTDPAADVQACKDAGADIVVCCMSWGDMLNENVRSSQKKMASALNKVGVDVIIGYNPHLVQPITWVESNGHKTLCIMSCGNFLSAVRSQPGDSGMIIQFTVKSKADGSGFEVADVQYMPTYVWAYKDSTGKGNFKTLNIGSYTQTRPDGMDDKQYKRMAKVWKETKKTVGSAATIVSE